MTLRKNEKSKPFPKYLCKRCNEIYPRETKHQKLCKVCFKKAKGKKTLLQQIKSQADTFDMRLGKVLVKDEIRVLKLNLARKENLLKRLEKEMKGGLK